MQQTATTFLSKDFSQIVQDYKDLVWSRVHSFAPSFLKVNSIHTKDDLYQFGCVALWKAYNTFDETRGIKFLTYATTYINNALCQELKSQKSQVRDSSNTVYLDEKSNSYAADFSQDIEGEVTSKRLIEDLSPDDQTAIVMLAEGYAIGEIAAVLGLSYQGTHRRIKRIKLTIKRGLYNE